MKNNYLFSLAILLALLPILLFRDYTPLNELRYLNIVDEALRNGHFLTFTNQGIPYADKPPLHFWMLMFSRWLLGGHYVWLHGLFSLIPALLVMGIMDRWVRQEVPAAYRLTGKLMLMSCGLFLGLAIIIRMDMLMTLFIVLALYTFYRLFRNEGNQKRLALLFPVYLFLAIFSKGPVGILIPLLVTSLFLLVTGRIRTWGKYWGWRTWTILLACCSLWFAGVYLEGGSAYLNNLLFHQTIDRAVNSFHHDEPFYYYFISVWYSLAPWSLLLIGVLVTGMFKKLVKSDLELFFLVTLLTIWGMLSCISSKIEVYLLPAFPFFVYLTVLWLPRFRWNRWLALTIAVPSALFLLATPVLIGLGFQPSTDFLKQPLFYVAAGALTLSGACSLFYLYRKKSVTNSINTLAAGLFIALFLGGLELPAINNQIGYADLCRQAAAISQEKKLSGYLTLQISRSENMNVYLNQEVKAISIEEMLTNNYQGKLLMMSIKAVKNNPEVGQFIEMKESYQVGKHLIVIL